MEKKKKKKSNKTFKESLEEFQDSLSQILFPTQEK